MNVNGSNLEDSLLHVKHVEHVFSCPVKSCVMMLRFRLKLSFLHSFATTESGRFSLSVGSIPGL